MKLKLAVFENIKNNIIVVAAEGMIEYYSDGKDYVQLTEKIEVDFQELVVDKIQAKCTQIDNEILDLQGKIQNLETKKKELLCLEHSGEEND